MPLHNAEIVEMFNEVGDLLEVEGANPFRVRAYRNAALTVGALPQSVADMVAHGDDLSELPGIGKDLAGKIGEIVRTGKLPLLEELHAHSPPRLRELLRLPGLGPKRVRVLHQDLGIGSLADLQKAAEKGLVHQHAGFGPKTEQKILHEIARHAGAEVRVKWIVAEEIARSFVAYLRTLTGIGQVEVAGSFRRRKETVGDLDIVVTARDGVDVMGHCVAFDEVAAVLARGPTKCSLRLRCGLQVDIRLVPNASFGAALHYFTGSKAHNIAVRKMGVARHLKISEYGVFQGDRQVAGTTEAEVYAQVGLPFIEPELREDSGEIQAAQENHLPDLLSLQDIRGDLHCHTTDSDGRNTLAEMADAARQLGYEYLAISDHSRRLRMAHGLDARRLGAQLQRIDRLNARLAGITVLKSCEVDILEDGSLDLPEEILQELDLTVCSIHSRLDLPRAQQTSRLLRAMDHPCFHILGHPTGRLINRRPASDLDLECVMRAAAERGCCLEINAQPDRLDLSDTNSRMARELGVKLVISTDAHRSSDLGFMRLGVAQARRGWVEARHVINTRRLADLRALLRRT